MVKGEQSPFLSQKERVDLGLFPWKPDWCGMPAVISNNSASGTLGREDCREHLWHKGASQLWASLIVVTLPTRHDPVATLSTMLWAVTGATGSCGAWGL